MKNILSYFSFIEESRGMPVAQRVGIPLPELKEKNKIAIFMLGPPASGKSTFVKKVILPINDKFKQVNSDDISMIIQKWKEEGGSSDFVATFDPDRKATSKAHSYISQMIKSGNNFIYDTTGSALNVTLEFANIARDNGFKVIFIHVLVDLKTALERVQTRGRANTQPPVDREYVITSHKGAVSLIKSYIKGLDWSTDSYYAVTTNNFELNFYKFTKSGKIFHYFNRSYIETPMDVAEFYRKLNEGLRTYYGYDVLLEDLGIKKEDYEVI